MGKKKQADEKRSTWEPTRYQHLFRYVSSGIIFARFKIGGKQVRQSLETPNLELAKNKLTELQRTERTVVEEQKRGKMVFREALEEYLESVRCDATLKPITRDYYEQRSRTLYKSWPGLADLDVRRISVKDCEQWAKRFSDLDGQPYALALNFGYKPGAAPTLYFHCARQGKKLDLIQANPKAAFIIDRELGLITGPMACDWGMDYESTIGKGN